MLPLHYEKISHEDDFYGRDVVDFVHSDKGSVGKCVVHRMTYSRDTALVKFKFSQDGRKKSSDDIDAWISMNPKHIPLMIRGKLPIGEMRVYYNSK